MIWPYNSLPQFWELLNSIVLEFLLNSAEGVHPFSFLDAFNSPAAEEEIDCHSILILDGNSGRNAQELNSGNSGRVFPADIVDKR